MFIGHIIFHNVKSASKSIKKIHSMRQEAQSGAWQWQVANMAGVFRACKQTPSQYNLNYK